MMASRYTRCPNCRRKAVTLRLARNGEDFYKCARCGWEVYSQPAFWDDDGKKELARYDELNQTKS